MAIVLALVAAAVYGVADYLGGRASRVHPAAVVTAIGQTVSLVLLIAAVIVQGVPAPDTATFIWSLSGGVLGALALLGLYYSFSHGSMTVTAPLSAVVSAVVPVGAGLIIGDRPKLVAYFGIIVALGAVVLVSGAVGERHQPTPVGVALIAAAAGAGFGLFFVAIERAADDAGFWPLMLARCASVPLLVGVCLATKARPGTPSRLLGLAAIAGVLDMAANVLYLLAIERGMLSLVVVVVALYPASTVALASVIDRERVNRWQMVGMGLAVAAIVLVTLGR